MLPNLTLPSSRPLRRALLTLALLTPSVTAAAQQSPVAAFLDHYQQRVTATQNEQPHWITPLVTVTPRLEQEYRTDFVRQTNKDHQTIWNYGNGKGLELIPFRHIELLFNPPPFLAHNTGAQDGFGDVSFLAKYRIFARNEQHGNAILTAFLGASIPTGKNANGLCCAVVTPSLAGGKGFGPVSFTTTLGGSLPVSNKTKLGHAIFSNTAIQYHVAKTGFARFLWPEAEFNANSFYGGSNDGKIMTFATPGIVLGRIPLTHDASGKPGRLGLTFGAGEQIALTHFHTYNHAIVLTARIPF